MRLGPARLASVVAVSRQRRAGLAVAVARVGADRAKLMSRRRRRGKTNYWSARPMARPVAWSALSALSAVVLPVGGPGAARGPAMRGEEGASRRAVAAGRWEGGSV